MKIQYILCLIIVLLLTSCNKRYGYLQKIRVDHTTTSVRKLKKELPKQETIFEFPEASDTTESTPAIYLQDKVGLEKYQDEEQKPTKDLLSRKLTISTSHKRNKELPNSHSEEIAKPSRKHSLWSLVFSLLVISLASCIVFNPLIFVPATLFAATFAFDEGSKGYKEMKHSGQKGKWKPLLGIFLGGLVLALALAAIFTFAMVFSASAVSTLVLASIFSGLFALAYAGVLWIAFNDIYAKRIKPLPPVKPPVTVKPKPAPEKHSFNRNAWLSISFAGLFFLSALILAFETNALLGLLLLVSPVVAIILGIIALKQIHKTPQKGTWMAWAGILAIPELLIAALLVVNPFIGLLVLLTGGIIWWLKRRKKNHI